MPGLLSWPGVIEAGRQSDGLFNLNDVLPTLLGLAGETAKLPTDRYIDGVDQTSFLLAPNGLSNCKYHYYWLVNNFSGLRCGEYKMLLTLTSDDASGSAGPWRLHWGFATFRLRSLVQPLSRSEGNAQSHDTQAGLR